MQYLVKFQLKVYSTYFLLIPVLFESSLSALCKYFRVWGFTPFLLLPLFQNTVLFTGKAYRDKPFPAHNLV
jgi:hypothetical protein